MGSLTKAMEGTKSVTQTNASIGGKENDDSVNFTTKDGQPTMSTEAFLHRVQQLDELVDHARVLAQSLGAAASEALGTSVYSETALRQVLNSIQSSSTALDTFAKQGHQFAKFDRFTLFPKLPIELRIKIWKAAMPGPRVIPMWRFVEEWEEVDDDSYNDSVHEVTSIFVHHPPPTVLHVCQESRSEALKKNTWKPDTENRLSNDRLDPKEDVVYLVEIDVCTDMWDYAEDWTSSILGSIQHLAIDSCCWRPRMATVLIESFTGLKTFTLVMKCVYHVRVDYDGPPGPRTLGTNLKLVDFLGDRLLPETVARADADIQALEKAYKQHIVKAEKDGVQFVPPLLHVKALQHYKCPRCEEELENMTDVSF